MSLVEIEIGRHRWDDMQLPPWDGSTAEDLPPLLLGLARAETKEEVDACDPSGYLFTDAFLNKPAVPAVSVLLAALVDGVGLLARERILNLLLFTAAAEGHSGPLGAGGPDLVEQAHVLMREGLWLLCSEVLHAPTWMAASDAFEVIEVLHEEGDEWVESLRHVVRERFAGGPQDRGEP